MPRDRNLFPPDKTELRETECLGQRFSDDAARASHFRQLLRRHLADKSFRALEGFPIGTDDDILGLSDPPYFTACPNPFLADIIACHGHDGQEAPYHRDPFAADVSEGRGDPVYNAHGYHTKVPYKAIMRYILHYTAPGAIIFDGFCGTGMTGIAASLCDDRETVESLGYQVMPDGSILDSDGTRLGSIGCRSAILSDLSPIAAFIAGNYNTPGDCDSFLRLSSEIANSIEHNLGWMLRTLHKPSHRSLDEALAAMSSGTFAERAASLARGRIHYTIWSDVFSCPDCGAELVYWNEAVDVEQGKVRDAFPCPKCRSQIGKRQVERVWDSAYDPLLKRVTKVAKHVPVRINYTLDGKTFEKVPDQFDLAVVDKVAAMAHKLWFPSDAIKKGDKTGDPFAAGINHVHQYFTRRNLCLLSALWDRAETHHLRWAITGIMQRASKQHQIAITRIGGEKAGEGGATAGHRRGTLYIPSNQVEFNPLDLFSERVKTIAQGFQKTGRMARRSFVAVASATATGLPSESIDYIFVDPPFGGNIMYSELNFAWESLIRVFTNTRPEAIQNKTQGKALGEYQELMVASFQEFYRVLKPGRWMTVEFHNSKNIVWNAIQEALQRAGFVVADVRVLDKQLKTHTQRTAAGAVNQDLVISAYRPDSSFERAFGLEAGTAAGVWRFVRSHLAQLPVFVSKKGTAEVIAERQKYLLYDRMLAFHVERGISIPLSASEFYLGLEEHLHERDGMYFLPEQVTEYDRRRVTIKEFVQMELFVADESSAIQWLKQQLLKKPQTFQELQPQYLREIGGWVQHEETVELSLLLQENFLCFEGSREVPSQIHSYLSSNFKELRGLDKDDARLVAKARNRWYVPDVRKEADLEQLRHRNLLKEFRKYLDTKGKLKVVRTEAVRAGFAECWRTQDFRTIVQLAKRVPEAVIQEDQALLMYYDNAVMRAGE